MNVNPKPPAEIAFVADLAGAEAALKFVESFGGTTIYVPKEAAEDCPLAGAIGFAAARLLAEQLGGERVKVPLLKFWRIMVYRNQGKSYSEIARALQVSEDTVWRHLARRGVTGAGRDATAKRSAPDPRGAFGLRDSAPGADRMRGARPANRGR